MSALDIKLIRDLRRIWGQVLAIALVIGCGVATVVMSFGALQSLDQTREAYYDRHRFADVFATVRRAPLGLVDEIAAIPGVGQVEARIARYATIDVAGMDEPATGRFISLPDDRPPLLNTLALRRGRLPDPARPDEAVVSENFAEAHGLEPGDRLRAIVGERERDLLLVGVALSPEYIYALGPGQLMPDDRRFGIFWMSRSALEAAYDLVGAFDDVSLTLLRNASEPFVIDRLDALLAPYGGVGAYGRKDQISHAFLTGELDQLRAIGRIVPPIFLGVAAFLLHMVVSRLIETEREQIGLLKAFGYGDMAVGWHYLKLVLVLTGLGIAFGFAAGSWLGYGMTELYARFYRFPILFYRPAPANFAVAASVAAGAAVAGTLGTVRRAVRLPPAVAMTPAPPAVYRRTALARLGLDRLATGPTRMIVRHVARWPLRSGLTVLGIAMAVALLTASLFSFDAIDRMLDAQFYRAQRQDATVVFEEAREAGILDSVARLPGVLRAEGFRSVPVRLHFGPRVRLASIQGLEPDGSLVRVLDADLRPVVLPPEGLVLSTALAERLGASAGDFVTVDVLEGARPTVRVHVAAVIEEYIGTEAYMDRQALNRLVQEGPVLSGAFLDTDPLRETELWRRLKEIPSLARVTERKSTLQAFRSTIAETMTTVVFFYVLFAGAMAFGVLYNSARIALSERGRELASLRVLGFSVAEVGYILLGELGLLTALALPLGCILGRGLAWIIASGMESELFRVPLVIADRTYGIAVLVVILSATLSGAAVGWRVRRLDLIAVLKTRE